MKEKKKPDFTELVEKHLNVDELERTQLTVMTFPIELVDDLLETRYDDLTQLFLEVFQVLDEKGLTVYPLKKECFLVEKGNRNVFIPPSYNINLFSPPENLETLKPENYLNESGINYTLYYSNVFQEFLSEPTLELRNLSCKPRQKILHELYTKHQVQGYPFRDYPYLESDTHIYPLLTLWQPLSSIPVYEVIYLYFSWLEWSEEKSVVPIALLYEERVFSLYRLNIAESKASIVNYDSYILID